MMDRWTMDDGQWMVESRRLMMVMMMLGWWRLADEWLWL
jgi:hypothetical protein